MRLTPRLIASRLLTLRLATSRRVTARLPGSRTGRALVVFWTALLLAGGIAALTLQWLGPIRPPPAVRQVAALTPRPAIRIRPVPPAPEPARPIATPDDALLEAAPDYDGFELPRIAADGRQARLVYAGRPPRPSVPPHPVIGILLEGLGLSAADSADAIGSLPAPVSLAVSPYAPDLEPLLAEARRQGHELLVSLPMEPLHAPNDDEGPQQLTDDLDTDQNQRRLEWALSRLQGYAGVTNALSGLAGEGFARLPAFAPIARGMGARGLFYLNATPGADRPLGVWSATADVRLDETQDAAAIDARLLLLEQTASRNGHAIGVAGPLYPVTVARIAEWSRGLAARGMILVPVSSLATAPEDAGPAPRGGR
ncbi:divergent polysaccharide deacetylase family protein [Lichenicoccus roseus]|uniref:Divergent polysaccharide deacetylase family protein n=1 Tax=Lichenicoccus roseus TaxID=2683649 RepID=A0A5R9J8S5_9PROT|nr:divergent polysaccharide deacetylase family protein [Lichenicoccus roseus]TLU73995.1 divergent polysaccharide deacetylase family protein [Lichenicoccus roseus]